jgi:transcriptional regulator with XRE-family HTH domain
MIKIYAYDESNHFNNYICNNIFPFSQITMVNSADFAKRLQSILDFYGLSATAFSDLIDFNRSTISHLLSGRNKPSLEFVLKVLQKFPEVELYWLLNGKGHFPAPQNDPEEKPIASTLTMDPTTDTPPLFQKIKTSPSLDAITKEEGEIDRIVIFFKDGSFKSYL